MQVHRKIFAYVTRITRGVRELLVLDSLDEPGFEVPKGAVEDGKSLVEAVHRELLEEVGITGAAVVRELARIDSHGERQHFFLVEAPSGLPCVMDPVVTGTGIDAGLRYRFHWPPIERALRDRFVQGCDRFVDELLAALQAS
jgi:8-oxo-dGTP pyrophosphatase MutT (NUDIX family)